MYLITLAIYIHQGCELGYKSSNPRVLHKDVILGNGSNLIPERGQTIALCGMMRPHTRAANKSKCAPKERKI